MNFREFSFSNKVRIFLYLAILPLPWLTEAVLQLPLYIAETKGGEIFVVAIEGMRSSETGALICSWESCGGSASLAAAKTLLGILFPVSIGFLFFAGISLIKGISIKYLKTVKGIILAMLLTGYGLALYGMKQLPESFPELTLTGGFRMADAAVMYMVVVLLMRMILFKKQSGD
ncbi:MAG: hypothetical protein IT279_03485 [Ignavibacteriaceae bacterium]|nr:hypothetical protein [Ignavibacteriaceae bacterium]